jgi:uroporphyrinogen decarboxylase
MMTPRERVIKALNHEEPDRVPIDLFFHAGMLTDASYFALKQHLGIEGDIAPFRQGLGANYYDERILEALDIDLRRVFMEAQHELAPLNEEEAQFVDAWGTVFVSGPGYTHPVGPPLAEIDSIGALRDYPWPKAEQFGETAGLRAQAERLYTQTDYAIALRRPGIRGGLLDKGGDLRGMEQFMMDLALDPDYCRALMEILAEIYVEVYTRALKEVGPYVQIVEAQDDLGAQLQPLISPNTWREIIKPSQKYIFDAIHQAAPQAKIIFHTDGNVHALIPDLIECGVDVLNPIQPSARLMDSFKLKQEFGGRLAFHGAMDVQTVLNRDEAFVREDVRTRIRALGPGGGFILAPCNHIQHDIPPENVVAMYDEARSFGVYPLRGEVVSGQ